MNALWSNKKLKLEIASGIPVPLRGHAWQYLAGNKLRINTHMFEMLKHLSSGFTLNPLVEADIPRTFPELSVLFEEI